MKTRNFLLSLAALVVALTALPAFAQVVIRSSNSSQVQITTNKSTNRYVVSPYSANTADTGTSTVVDRYVVSSSPAYSGADNSYYPTAQASVVYVSRPYYPAGNAYGSRSGYTSTLYGYGGTQNGYYSGTMYGNTQRGYYSGTMYGNTQRGYYSGTMYGNGGSRRSSSQRHSRQNSMRHRNGKHRSW